MVSDLGVFKKIKINFRNLFALFVVFHVDRLRIFNIVEIYAFVLLQI